MFGISSRRCASILLGASLMLAGGAAAFAQTKTTTKTVVNATSPWKPWTTGDRPDLFEVSPFGGGSFFNRVDTGLGTWHDEGAAVGVRVTENFWKYVGLEQGYTYSVNNVNFLRPAQPHDVNFGFGSRINQFYLDAVVHFTERGSRIRPYLLVGVGGANFGPTTQALDNVKTPLYERFHAQGLKSNLLPMLNYGGGVKIHLSDAVGLRFDVRGLWSKNPTYGLPDTQLYPPGGVYIPRDDKLYGLQTTVGINFYFGKRNPPPPPPAPKPVVAPPPPLGPLDAGRLTGGEGTLCQGREIVLNSTATDSEGRPLTYHWIVDGTPVAATGGTVRITPTRAGTHTIELEVSAPNNEGYPVRVAKGGPWTITVQEYRVPTATACSANPSSINVGDTSALSVSGTGSPCSSIRYSWTVSEGTVSPATSASSTFDSKSVTFDAGAKPQTKTIRATATVTDDRGATADCTTNVVVKYTPQAVRFGDLIFNKSGARVNNCAKRILLEEVVPKAADLDYDVVLVGHYDADEAGKGKVPSTLDKQRANNAAAVLSGGSGTCGSIDPSRIQVDYVGTDQTADKQPGLCGTSARVATKERKGSVVSNADENRRVEVWLVPKGTTMPASVKNPQTIPAKDLKKLGCPK